MLNIVNQKIAEALRRTKDTTLSKDERDMWYARLERLLAWRERIA